MTLRRCTLVPNSRDNDESNVHGPNRLSTLFEPLVTMSCTTGEGQGLETRPGTCLFYTFLYYTDTFYSASTYYGNNYNWDKRRGQGLESRTRLEPQVGYFLAAAVPTSVDTTWARQHVYTTISSTITAVEDERGSRRGASRALGMFY
jgi:hypothetical protein